MATSLGVCYYPEHWPRTEWPEHAAAMRELGVDVVRIGEFAWSRLEPVAGRYDWDWLDEAIAVLHDAGLGIVLGTPTACPPKWLVDADPDILPRAADGSVRGFGSRRHYRFWSDSYRAHSERIVRALAGRYGHHPAVVGWQTDNEFGCHDTTLSYGADDLAAYRAWLKQRYGTVDHLNDTWGTVFWSQEYRRFDDIELPVATVTEANPAQRLSFRRFGSDGVRRFNRSQCRTLRAHSRPGVWITHNFMGDFTDFDHFELGTDLDIATWDSYPLGFLDQSGAGEAEKLRYRRSGHPDWAAFHHDLYRGVGRGRFGVMEQQPGAVNWAPNNAAPAPGMLRVWGLEAVAHGAELVSFFRWRQLPVAQEQCHAALTLPDGSASPARAEVAALRADLDRLGELPPATAKLALVFDYASVWIAETQPPGEGFDLPAHAFAYYRAARRLGLDVDIVPPGGDFDGYDVVLVPAATVADAALVDAAEASTAQWLIGPRSGSRTAEFAIPGELPPGPWQRLLPLRVIATDALRPGAVTTVEADGERFTISALLEQLQTDLAAAGATVAGEPVWLRHGRMHYLAAVADDALLQHIIAALCRDAGLPLAAPAGDLRLRRRGPYTFVINYGPDAARWRPHAALPVIGGERLAPASVAVWRDADEQ